MLLSEIQKERSQDYNIFVDLDGVIANFQKGVEKIISRPYSEEDYETDPAYRKEMWSAVHKHNLAGGELWYELELMPDAHILWDFVAPHQPQILSATGKPEYGAEDQKRRWVAEKIGRDVVVNLTRKAADKAQHACESCILIDDKEKAIKPWEAAGGIGVLHTSAANTIAQLKQLGL